MNTENGILGSSGGRFRGRNCGTDERNPGDSRVIRGIQDASPTVRPVASTLFEAKLKKSSSTIKHFPAISSRALRSALIHFPLSLTRGFLTHFGHSYDSEFDFDH
jgi:hypothetical protein